MYTYCPNCAAVFQVTATQLSRADGKVRCGECRHVYVATQCLFDSIEATRAALDVETDPALHGGAEPPVDYVRAPDEIHTVEAGEIPVSPPQPGGWEQNTFSARDLVSGLGIVSLLLLLGIQWVYFNRAELAADSAWRPAVDRFCSILQCTLPLQPDLASLAIVDRDVRKHPTVEQALLINAAFENRADFTQPYPVFEISFTDSSGGPVAVRRFLPREYLLHDVDQSGGMHTSEKVHVVLEVMDPGDDAVSFQFGFL